MIYSQNVDIRYMNFDQIGKQNVSKRRKPSPVRNVRRVSPSFEASFSQSVSPRSKHPKSSPRNKIRQKSRAKPQAESETPKEPAKKRLAFKVPELGLKNIALFACLLAAGIVGIHWEGISKSFSVGEVSPQSLQDISLPPAHLEAAAGPIAARIFSSQDEVTSIPAVAVQFDSDAQFDSIEAFKSIPLSLTEVFSWTEYEVQSGDTISGIASKFSRNMGSIIAFNNLTEAWNLRIGKKLKIPSMDGVPYTVQKNDTLSGIAKKMETPEAVILDANDMPSSFIRSGDILFIPGAKMSSADLNRAIRKDAGKQNIAERMFFPIIGRITSNYGWRIDPVNPKAGRGFHHAIDLSGKTGDPVKAAMGGTVLNATHNPNLGNFIILGHGDYQTLYAHLSAFSVKIGDSVKQGQEIGKIGDTGYTTGPHLHFEVFLKGKRINPLDVLK
jgi:murein DD-endopeptidase MepM/ murein hydrolase activator NlpD